MSRIKNMDTLHVRGERTVTEGFNNPLGLQELTGFDFNKNAVLGSVLKKTFAFDAVGGTLALSDFITGKHLQLPAGATQIGLRLAASQIDFDAKTYEFVESTQEVLPVDLFNATNTVLTLPSVPSGTGLMCFFFLIEFFQEINGTAYPLKNKQYNVLNMFAIV
jgi:hypothetical protein